MKQKIVLVNEQQYVRGIENGCSLQRPTAALNKEPSIIFVTASYIIQVYKANLTCPRSGIMTGLENLS